MLRLLCAPSVIIARRLPCNSSLPPVVMFNHSFHVAVLTTVIYSSSSIVSSTPPIHFPSPRKKNVTRKGHEVDQLYANSVRKLKHSPYCYCIWHNLDRRLLTQPNHKWRVKQQTTNASQLLHLMILLLHLDPASRPPPHLTPSTLCLLLRLLPLPCYYVQMIFWIVMMPSASVFDIWILSSNYSKLIHRVLISTYHQP